MGKGDQRTKRGKLFRGSHGKPLTRKAAPRPKPEPRAAQRPPSERPRPERPRPEPPQPEQPQPEQPQVEGPQPE